MGRSGSGEQRTGTEAEVELWEIKKKKKYKYFNCSSGYGTGSQPSVCAAIARFSCFCYQRSTIWYVESYADQRRDPPFFAFFAAVDVVVRIDTLLRSTFSLSGPILFASLTAPLSTCFPICERVRGVSGTDLARGRVAGCVCESSAPSLASIGDGSADD